MAREFLAHIAMQNGRHSLEQRPFPAIHIRLIYSPDSARNIERRGLAQPMTELSGSRFVLPGAGPELAPLRPHRAVRGSLLTGG